MLRESGQYALLLLQLLITLVTWSLVNEVPTTTAYKWWNCQVFRPANCCQLILPNRFLDGFPDPSQFAAAKLTHYSSKPTTLGFTIMATHPALRTPEPWSYYKGPVCARNVTSRGVSYLCNRCSGWVHSQLLQFPTHTTETTTATTSNTSCR